MRIVFMGTPEFAQTILEKLADAYEVVAVFSRPDAVRGRGKKLVPSPVKELALSRDIPVYTPRTLRDEVVADTLRSLNPDAICVAAYGAIVPPSILEIPRFGCFNVHASLLPRWRGAAPIERAILAGDERAGVCIMRMEEGLDTGDFCLSESVEVGDTSAEELTAQLASLGGDLMVEALRLVQNNALVWNSQDEAEVTYAHKLEKGELNLNPSDSAQDNVRRVQASGAAHAARAVLAGRPGTVITAHLHEDIPAQLAPGELRYIQKQLVLGCEEGCFCVTRFKPDGKQAMDAPSFAAGCQGLKGDGYTWEAVDA